MSRCISSGTFYETDGENCWTVSGDAGGNEVGKVFTGKCRMCLEVGICI